MRSKQTVLMCTLGLTVLLLSGCWGTVVRPLQINPNQKPEIIIYHHIQLRTAPIVYLITLNEEISLKWKSLKKGDNKIIVNPKEDFQLICGHQVDDKIYTIKDYNPSVTGTLELDYDSVFVNLQIIPGSGVNNHPIDGKYRFTKNEPIEITY